MDLVFSETEGKVLFLNIIHQVELVPTTGKNETWSCLLKNFNSMEKTKLLFDN